MVSSRAVVLIAVGLAGVVIAGLVWRWGDAVPVADAGAANDRASAGAPLAGSAEERVAGAGRERAVVVAPLASDDALPPGLRGRVLQDGVPVPSCVVEVCRSFDPGGPPPLAVATAAADGRFVVGGLPPGLVVLQFSSASLPRPALRADIQVPADRFAELGDIDLPQPARLHGRVVDGGGRPVAGVRVFHHHRPGYSTTRFDRGTAELGAVRDAHVQTDLDGRFAFGRLPAGDHAVLVEPAAAERYRDQRVSLELVPGEDRDLGDLELVDGQVLVGRVVDPQGRGVAAALVAPASRRGEIARRRGARTADDGRFVLHGLPPRGLVSVEADGYLPRTQDRDGAPSPMLIRIEPAFAVRGVVRGAKGAPTVVEVMGRSRPSGIHRAGVDGAFSIPGLAAGAHRVRARAPGVGSSAVVEVEVPRSGDQPVVLDIVPGLPVTVRVVDDTGLPIAGVRVVRDPGIERSPRLYRAGARGLTGRVLRAASGAGAQVARTDMSGAAILAIESGVAFAIGARHEGHLDNVLIVRADERPATAETWTLTMARGGRIKGVIDDASGRRRFALRAALWPVGVEKPTEQQTRLMVDDAGVFASAPLQPGRYVVSVYRYNMTWQDAPSRRLPDVVPLLGHGTDPRGWQEVEVLPGEDTEVTLAVEPLGTVAGVVRQNGTPVGGAVVYAVETGARVAPGRTAWTDRGAHERVPFAVTDVEGRYSFSYVAPGRWRLFALAPGGDYPKGPVEVVATDFGQHWTRDFELPATRVRGRFVSDQGGAHGGRGLRAYLFPLHAADRDPYYQPHHALPQTAERRAQPLDGEGAFAFASVLPGRWVLRITDGERSIAQRVVSVADTDVDLGVLRPTQVVEAVLHCADARVAGAWVRRPVEGSERGVFVQTVALDDGVLRLAVPAGRYLIEPFERSQWWGVGLSGKSLDQVVAVEIDAAGAAVPAVLAVR